MFSNVSVEFGSATSLLIRWEWIDNKDRSCPSCRVFYCGIPENKLLEKGLFLQNEIANYFNDNVINIYSPNVRQEIESFNGRNTATSRLNNFQRERSDRENRQLPLPDGTQNHIFLVCVYDDNEFVYRIISSGGKTEIPFTVVKPGFFKKLMKGSSSGRQAIQLTQNTSRKKVVEYQGDKSVVYSVLPDGHDQYYFDESVDLSKIKIYHLSSLIGKPGFDSI